LGNKSGVEIYPWIFGLYACCFIPSKAHFGICYFKGGYILKNKFMKILAFAAVAVLMGAFAITVSAATASADIIAKLQADGVSAVDVAKAQDFFKSNTLTSAQLDTISAQIDVVHQLMVADNVTDPSLLPAADKAKVQSAINTAASAAGVSVTYNGGGSITLSKNGTTLLTLSDKDVKQTGANNTGFYAVIASGMLLIAAGSILLVNRRRTSAKAVAVA
jgi:hypothetical protein